MNLLSIFKIAFFSLITIASLATIYFLSSFKEELGSVVAQLQSMTQKNTELTNIESGLETTNAGIASSITDIEADIKLVEEKTINEEALMAGVQAEITSVINKTKREQPEAKTIEDQLAKYESSRSDINKISRYNSQIEELELDIQNTQSEIASSTAINQSLLSMSKVNEEIIDLFQTSTVYPNFKAKVTQIVPNWKIVLLDAGFHQDRLSPNTKLTVVRNGEKVADLVVSRVAKDKSVASIEKYYTITNELGEEQEASITIGDQVVGAVSNETAA